MCRVARGAALPRLPSTESKAAACDQQGSERVVATAYAAMVAATNSSVVVEECATVSPSRY